MSYAPATAAVKAIRTAINEELANGFVSLPVGPFSIECSYSQWNVEKIERFADAALSLVSLRKNQPNLIFALFDADGYIVNGVSIKYGLAIKAREAEGMISAIESYL